MFRMTIFAARRVLPPDLMTPANASKPRMKLTGPLAVPPPFSPDLEDLYVPNAAKIEAAVMKVTGYKG